VIRRALTTGLLAGLLTGAALLAGATPAAAHNTLVSANPADGARLSSGPPQVTLTFDQPVQRGFSTLTVTGPDGNRWEAGEPAVSGNEVTAPVRPLGPAGDYVVGYRIVSADGHPVSGSLRFTLTAAGTGTPAEPPPDAGAGQDQGMPVWPWIVGAVLLLGAGVLLALRLGRPAGPPR
jgi:copper resistance protein C